MNLIKNLKKAIFKSIKEKKEFIELLKEYLSKYDKK